MYFLITFIYYFIKKKNKKYNFINKQIHCYYIMHLNTDD